MDAVQHEALVHFLRLGSRTLTHLTAAMARQSFTLLKSTDPDVRLAAQDMLDNLSAISTELDQQWQGMATLLGVHLQSGNLPFLEEVQMSSVDE
ncbi:hypothetical protein [Atopomonas hussainii]|uniref:hypothetical protein n=1 Tax=Atopomonas hussainii TaxID=1429083 RepID=UPI000900235A|nr:hypothetical protein [Atopomonas hussainii]